MITRPPPTQTPRVAEEVSQARQEAHVSCRPFAGMPGLLTTPVPLGEIETVFLDVGNTLVSMDFGLLCDVLACHGVTATPVALARAEAAARPALSRYLAGDSTESQGTFAFYVGSILEALGGEAAAGRDALAPRLAAHLRRTVPTERLWSRVLPGVPEALTALGAAGLALAAVSNSDGTVEASLAAWGLGDLLHLVVDSAVVGVEKPDARIFRHALDRAGAHPERTVHVGDLYAVDVVGARAAGIHAVLLDPYDDWVDADCARAPDVASLAREILARRS
jgi:putative hydrolase of the HAD superfamily